ncbi:hypothetical protein OY671_003746 [Metschnikowia pulcherrima]|nr:hypothetical protein OY671_003746 [Metschnikowia pulcherrima]
MALFSWLAPASHFLLETLTERTENNQAQLFTQHQNLIQKALAVAASVASIVFCMLAIYMFQAIDPKRLVFRHQLIAFLIFFDFLKATILLIFPARVMADDASYASDQFCQIVGFFTATATEGADLAILAFAVHTFLLIFKPSLNVKIEGSSHIEGGLYKFRYYVYGLSFVIPLAMASFPFIGVGYDSFVCWCYLPQRPYWYRAVLSWVPRYVIVIVILAVYVSIYFHVLREFRLLGGAFTNLHRQRLTGTQSAEKDTKPSFFSALMFFLRDVRAFIFPEFICCGKNPTPNRDNSDSGSNKDSSGDEHKTDSPGGPHDLENNLGDAEFHAANLESFQKRQRIIEKQMKSIFIYPVAYVSIWLFPFVLYCTQFSFEQDHGPVVWLNCLCAFIQPFMGVVDSSVFFYREQPWKYTIMRNFEKENEGKLDLALAPGGSLDDSESITTSARFTKSSLAMSMHVDLSKYSKRRRIMSRLRFPLMRLPSEDNIARFQTEHLKRKMDAARLAAKEAKESPAAHNEKKIDGLRAKHDFSNLLSGENGAGNCTPRFDSYSFTFQDDGRQQSLSSGNLSSDRRVSVASASNKSARSAKSAKSRRVSVFEGQDPIPENGTYMKSSTRTRSVPRKSVQTIESEDADEELDFLDFLARGPGGR